MLLNGQALCYNSCQKKDRCARTHECCERATGRQFMGRSQRTRALALCGGLLMLMLVLAACGGSSSATTVPSAQSLLQKAQTALGQITAYHFNLKAENLGAATQLPIQSADGDIVVPDKLQATANVSFAGATVQAQLIVV